MRALSGSGPAGLSGMAAMRGRLVRPLLPFPGLISLNTCASEASTVWVDPANADPRHLRSWIRTQLLPEIHQRLPQIDSNLERLSRQAANDRAAWDALLELLPGLDLRAENGGISVAATCLGDYDSALTQAVILALRPASRLRPGAVPGSAGSRSDPDQGERAAGAARGNWTAALEFDRLRILCP